MALLKPSGTLVLDIDERLAGKETLLEVRRCYTYIGTPVIRIHAPADADEPVRNVARLIVGLGMRKYLHSSDEGADELWRDVVEHWIGNMLYKIGHNMKAFNKRQRSIGLPELVFDRFDVELEGGTFVVGLRPDPCSCMEEELAQQVGLARELLNDGTIAGATRVDVPSEEAYETQCALAWEDWVAAHPEAEGGQAYTEDAEKVASEQGEPVQDATTGPRPDESYEEWLARDKEAKSYENTAVAPTDSDALPQVQDETDDPEKEAEEELFNFEVDYSMWELTFADGSARIFDAIARSFVD